MILRKGYKKTMFDEYLYLKHLIELWPGYCEKNLDMTNKEVPKKNINWKQGKREERVFQRNISGNLLGGLFWQKYKVRKDAGLGGNNMNLPSIILKGKNKIDIGGKIDMRKSKCVKISF